MAAKAAAFLITLVVNVALGVVVAFFMLIAMNGLNESDAEKGLKAYIALALIVSVLMSTAAYLLTRALLPRGFSGAAAVPIAAVLFSVVGGGLKIACGIIGIAVAEYVRVNY